MLFYTQQYRPTPKDHDAAILFSVRPPYEKYEPEHDMRNDLYDSYAPKKTNPPTDIHSTLGCIP
ncbi:hypothetical protein JZU54_01580, partial [bacterium]|nr:hypothetical protein [bacterium]